MATLDFKTRNIAVVDLETTGLDCKSHEIIEFGLVVCSQPSLEIVDVWETKIKPTHIETATEEAFKVNGYNKEEWEHAGNLIDALEIFAMKTEECILCGHNIWFDWSFLNEAFTKNGVKHKLDYHMLDTFTMVWQKLSTTPLTRANLNAAAEFVGLQPEPTMHRALNGAMTDYKLLKALKS